MSYHYPLHDGAQIFLGRHPLPGGSQNLLYYPTILDRGHYLLLLSSSPRRRPYCFTNLLSTVEIIVLFLPVVQRCTGGPRPATQNCTFFKIGCAWAILGAQVGLLGAQSTLFRLKKPGVSVPGHMAQFGRITYLEMWDSCPLLF
jgi:hypothetical protein